MNILNNLLAFEQELDDIDQLDDDFKDADYNQLQAASSVKNGQIISKNTAAAATLIVKQNECDHNRILGDPSSDSICLECDQHLSGRITKELDYRQFGLLFCNQREFLRADFGKTQVDEKKRNLIQQRKLVLVLDLDNTLLHSELFEVGRHIIVPGQPHGKTITCHSNCPLMQAHYRRKMIRDGGIHQIDKSKSSYHIWEPRKFTHRVKLRPFCAEFLATAMKDFEVHFNTAATRLYGVRIIQVLKQELLEHA